MRHFKLASLILIITLFLTGCRQGGTSSPAQVSIALSDGSVTVTGDESAKNGVFTSNDIIYYQDRETYDSGNPYGEGEASDRHAAELAAAHTVVNITAPGTYRLSGTMDRGQIRVDLGENAKTDPNAVVTLILDAVDITCEVAPAILFLNVYECDNQWSADTASHQVDTAAAGANLILADGSQNKVSGSYVARIYEDAPDEKKLWKQDGAIYSYMSMNVDGENTGTGVLDLTASNEGLDTELHLTLNGGNINIRAQNDGINTNEDGVSVTTINGGTLHIIAGLGDEGDGIDSNGWLVINGGTVVASANPAADAGLDSDMGSYVNGGTVAALGSTMDWAESDSGQVTMNLQFADYRSSSDAIVVSENNKIVFAYAPSQDEVLADNSRQYKGAILSCPQFELGDDYAVFIGGSVTGQETGGVYDPDTITEYNGGVSQTYTGTDVVLGGMRPGGMGGGRPMGPIPEGEMGERPQFPEGERPQFSEGMRPGGTGDRQRPERPEGEAPNLPQGGIMPPELAQDGVIPVGEPESVFHMQDKVNFFSGVANA